MSSAGKNSHTEPRELKRMRLPERKVSCFLFYSFEPTGFLKNGVADGTRTRNSQNHNLELYH